MTTTLTPKNGGDAAIAEWLKNAKRAVNNAFPQIDWTTYTEATVTAQAKLDFYLDMHFCHDGGIGNISLENVRDAWREYYRAHLPKD